MCVCALTEMCGLCVLLLQSEALFVLLQHHEVCQSLGAAGVPVSYHTSRSTHTRPNLYLLTRIIFVHTTPPWLFPIIDNCRATVCVCSELILLHTLFLVTFPPQMCVEKCPDKFMTLVKAYINKEDFKYYKNFCQEGLTDTMVLKMPGIFPRHGFQIITFQMCSFPKRCCPFCLKNLDQCL